MGLLKLLFGKGTKNCDSDITYEYVPSSLEEIEKAFENVWRSADGSYKGVDKELLGRYLGIKTTTERIEIKNNEVSKTISIADFPGCKAIDIGAFSPDFTRFDYSIHTPNGYWRNEASLIAGGIEHNTYKTCNVKLFDGKYRYFYFTIGNGKRSQITWEYIKEKYDVQYLENEFDDDDTLNVVVRENSKKPKDYYFLLDLGVAQSLSIYGVPAKTILSIVERDLYYFRNQHYHPEAYSESLIQLCRRIFGLIKEKYHFTDNETAQYIYNNYCAAGDGSTDRYYEEIGKASDYFKIYGNDWQKEYDKLFKRLILEDGYKTKWVSELTLYKMVVEEYEDAIYQYSADFLQGQSLDIFIPSINVGIEYQGIQHYQPVTLFGGEDGLKATQERDRRKKEKLKMKGVALIEWKYNEPISKMLLDQKIRELKIM